MEKSFQKILVFLPVFNVGEKIIDVIKQIRAVCNFPILVVNDGSDEITSNTIRKAKPDSIVEHERNLGSGAAIRTAFKFAKESSIESLVTIDADGQHEPKYIPMLMDAIGDSDMVTGTRFHPLSEKKTAVPPFRLKANQVLAEIISELIDYPITDSACGFRVYKSSAIKQFNLTVHGYGWPLQLWVQAVDARLKIKEAPISNIYPEVYRDLDQDSFSNALNYSSAIIRNESIKCCLKKILKFKIPQKKLLKFAFGKNHYLK